ncbi:hypothetical protein BaRGS_00013511 [Batillaria attramentaria]|uniref:Uncharacterized protein n=1 Tax=Batillaria attramentaria TaxID=370345 RepID=A0ABD0L6U7_9CAEN
MISLYVHPGSQVTSLQGELPRQLIEYQCWRLGGPARLDHEAGFRSKEISSKTNYPAKLVGLCHGTSALLSLRLVVGISLSCSLAAVSAAHTAATKETSHYVSESCIVWQLSRTFKAFGMCFAS